MNAGATKARVADARRHLENGESLGTQFVIGLLSECESALNEAVSLSRRLAMRRERVVEARHPLEVYADSYAEMARNGNGKVDCRSVEVDIRQNMIPVTRAALAKESGHG